MTYPIVRFCVRFVLGFFIKRKHIIGLSNVPSEGPVLLAVNHPNSFLDATKKSYQTIEKLKFDKMNYRKDIGFDL